jgi:DMSO/TMAO reductase YedYZ molybdopterin-dependent catalytic subunit
MRRRQFTLFLAALAGRIAVACTPLGLFLNKVWAQARRRLLSPQTEVGSLIYEDPDQLDPRNLPITPIAKFDTMGQTEYRVDVAKWRLNIGGAVARPQTLTLEQIKALPAIEHKVLLICPGAFAYYARWRGVSMKVLLQQAGVSSRATHVDVSGPPGESERIERFGLDEVETQKVFLAYGVNDVALPEKHGFPLRVVAQDHIGSEWVKFVDKIQAVSAKPTPKVHEKSQGPAFVP